MTFNLLIPELGKKTSSKDSILGVLINDWPLSLKEIYNRTKKQFSFTGSYQAIFKGVNELMSEKILIKNDRLYEINISWIKNLQSFTDVVETNYYANKKDKDVNQNTKKGGDVKILSFKSIFDLEKYLYYFVKNELKKKKNLEVYYEMNNLWKVLFYHRAEYNYYRKLMKLGHKFYFLSKGNSKIEEEAKAFYRKLGITVRSKKLNSMDIILFGDYYIQIFIPSNLKEKISKCLEFGNKFALLEILDKEIDSAKIIVHKDKSLASEVKNQFIGALK